MGELTVQTAGGFCLQPANLHEAMKMADMLAGSNMVPAAYRSKPADALVAMMMGAELGLHPIQAIQNIAVINGKPSIYGDAMLAIVQKSPLCEWVRESFDDKTMQATCAVKRKGQPESVTRFSQEDATTAQLWGKVGPWKSYPKRMLAMRARGFALRNNFADLLLGLISQEEAGDYREEREINPMQGDQTAYQPESVGEPLLPELTEEKFNELLPKYSGLINSGKPASDIIALLQSKYSVSQDQIKMIMEC